MANNPKITKDGFIGNLQGIADSAKELKVVDLGIIAGNTIEQVRAKLKATLLGLERLSPIVTMAYDDELVSEWNSGNTSYIVKEGSRKIFIPLSVYGQTNYQSWLVSSYYKSAQRIVSLENGVWQPFVTLATNVDLSSLKSELESKISSTSHTLYKASQLLDYTSDDGGVTPAGVKKAFDGQLTAKKVTPAGDANRPVYINSSGVPTAIDSVLDGNVNWGGANRVGDFGPIDAAMIPSLGANRLAFLPAKCITIEYSRDGGATWTEGSYTDSEKTSFFTQGLGCNLYIGGKPETGVDKSTHQVRVTIHDTVNVIYNIFKKIALYVSTYGSKSCWCTIQGRLQTDVEAGTDTWTTFVDKQRISGWSGWNVINVSFSTYGNLDNKDSQYGNVRFTFGCESHDQAYGGLNITQLLGFGGVGWSTPSTLAREGTLYRYLADQQVIFPSYVNSDKGFAITGGSNSQVLLAGGGTASTSSLSVESSKYFIDYGNEETKLRIGYSGAGLAGSTVQHFAAYDPITHYIKDLSTGEAKVALGISDYSTVKSNASKGAEASASLVSVKSDVNTIKSNYVSTGALESYVTKASVTGSTAAPGWGDTGTVGTVAGKAFKVTLPTKPTYSDVGAAAASHTHTKSQITDFPSSMPASDVYSWAKASTKPSYTKTEVGLGNVDNTADSNKVVKGLRIVDNRSENPAPASSSLTKNAVTADFKYASTLGLSGLSSYGGCINIMPWSETSGGAGYQLFFGYKSNIQIPKVFIRSADLSATSWGNWTELITKYTLDNETPIMHGLIETGENRDVPLVPGIMVVSSGTGPYQVSIEKTPTDEMDKMREAVWKVKVGTTVPTIAWPSGLLWANGEVPTLETNAYYEFNFSWCVDAWAVAYQMFKAV